MTSALWNSLLEAFAETMLAGVTFVTLFSFGVRSLSRGHGPAVAGTAASSTAVAGTATSPGAAAGPPAGAAGSNGDAVNVSEAGAVLCFVLCFVIVAFGIYLAATK